MIATGGSREDEALRESRERVRKAEEVVDREWVSHMKRMRWGLLTMLAVYVAVVLFLVFAR